MSFSSDNLSGTIRHLAFHPTICLKPSDHLSVTRVHVRFIVFDEQEVSTVEVYPNPAHDVVYVRTHLEDQATLQVIDLTGRILSSESINGSVSKAIRVTAGVYVLRLISGDDISTQKIVIQ